MEISEKGENSYIVFQADAIDKIYNKINTVDFENYDEFIKNASKIDSYLIWNGLDYESFLESINYMMKNWFIDVKDYLDLYQLWEKFNISNSDFINWKKTFLQFKVWNIDFIENTLKLKRNFREFIRMLDAEIPFDLWFVTEFIEEASPFNLLWDSPRCPKDDFEYNNYRYWLTHEESLKIMRKNTEKVNKVVK